MTDITPGFVFSQGQLVTHTNLNKIVDDAIINDGAIDAVKLSDDSISGAVTGHSTLPDADLDDSDWVLIYDTSASEIKKVAKKAFDLDRDVTLDALTINTDFNLQGSVTGDLRVDQSLFADGGKVFIGNDTSVASNNNHLFFHVTNDTTPASLSHTGDTSNRKFALTDGLDVNGTLKATNLTSEGSLTAEDVFWVQHRFLQWGNIRYIFGLEGSQHGFEWKKLTQTQMDDDALSVGSGDRLPILKNFADDDPNFMGLYMMINTLTDLADIQGKSTIFRVEGDRLALLPKSQDQDRNVNFSMQSRQADNTTTDWFLTAYAKDSTNVRWFHILCNTIESGVTNRVFIGTTTNPHEFWVYGEIRADDIGTGTLDVTGTKNFKIKHPVLDGKDLFHASIEAPQADLIYRGKFTLGGDPVNLDTNSNIAEGTFVKLVKDVQVFVQNNQGWDRVKGRVEGNLLYIDCENPDCTDEVDWMVVGERNDDSYKNCSSTDENGNFITEKDCDCEVTPPSQDFTKHTL